jgi:hypothetical protein
VRATGDLRIDAHYTVEDVGICLGQALAQALGDTAGIRRHASVRLPLDEALVTGAVDLSGRPFCGWQAEVPRELLGTINAPLAEEFWRAVASAGVLTLHVLLHSGRNTHHIVEAMFKAVARALRQAVDDELARLQTQLVDTPTVPQSNGQVFTPSSRPADHPRSGRPATASQVKAIRAIASRHEVDLDGLLNDEYGVTRPEELTVRLASHIIDLLRASTRDAGGFRTPTAPEHDVNHAHPDPGARSSRWPCAPPGACPRGDGCRRGVGRPASPATDRRGLALSLRYQPS